MKAMVQPSAVCMAIGFKAQLSASEGGMGELGRGVCFFLKGFSGVFLFEFWCLFGEVF